MTTLNKSLSTNGVANHYQELNHKGDIKLVFHKSDIFNHKSNDGKAFYTVRPIIVKIGGWIDDYINFTFTIKNKFYHIIKSKDIDLWCLTIKKDIKTFRLEDSEQDCEYHETSLQFINDPKLLKYIEKLYLTSSNVSEMTEDTF